MVFALGVGGWLALWDARKRGTIPRDGSAIRHLRAGMRRRRRVRRELLTRGERVVAWTMVLLSTLLAPAGVIILLSADSSLRTVGIALLVLALVVMAFLSHPSCKRVCVAVNGRVGVGRGTSSLASLGGSQTPKISGQLRRRPALEWVSNASGPVHDALTPYAQLSTLQIEVSDESIGLLRDGKVLRHDSTLLSAANDTDSIPETESGPSACREYGRPFTARRSSTAASE